MSVELTVVTVTYNSADHIADNLAAMEDALAPFDAEILVVDNASSDTSVTEARRVLRRGRVIESGENLGFGRGVNLGLVEARGAWTMIMNDDARIDSASIELLLEAAASDPAIGLVGPRIVGEDGETAPSARYRFPGWAEEWQRVRRLVGLKDPDYPISEEPHDVAWLVGACVLGSTQLLRKVGGFNPAFFLYGEDIDLCRRLAALGYRRVTVPKATCVHTQGVATSRVFDSDARSLRQMSGRAVYYRIWFSPVALRVIQILRGIGLRGGRERFGAYLRLAVAGSDLRHLRFPPPLPGPPA